MQNKMEDLTLEEKCEKLMSVVVESRKKLGKMCVDYELKTSLVENKILNLQVETISKYRCKPKQAIPNIDVDDMRKDIEDFEQEIVSRHKKIEEFKKRLRNTKDVVSQIKADSVTRNLRQPLTAEALLSKAKQKRIT